MFFKKREKKILSSSNESNKNQEIAEIIEKKDDKKNKISNLSDEMLAKALKNLLSKE